MSASRSYATLSPPIPRPRVTGNARINAAFPRSKCIGGVAPSLKSSSAVTSRMSIQVNHVADATDSGVQNSLLYRSVSTAAREASQDIEHHHYHNRTSLADALLERSCYRLTAMKFRELMSLHLLDLPLASQQDLGNVTLGTLFRVQILNWMREDCPQAIAALDISDDALARLLLLFTLQVHAKSDLVRQPLSLKLSDLGTVNIPLWELQDFKYMMLADIWSPALDFDINMPLAAFGNPNNGAVLNRLTKPAEPRGKADRNAVPTRAKALADTSALVIGHSPESHIVMVSAAALDKFVEVQGRLLESAQSTLSMTNVLLGAVKIALGCFGTLGLLALISTPAVIKEASDTAASAASGGDANVREDVPSSKR